MSQLTVKDHVAPQVAAAEATSPCSPAPDPSIHRQSDTLPSLDEDAPPRRSPPCTHLGAGVSTANRVPTNLPPELNPASHHEDEPDPIAAHEQRRAAWSHLFKKPIAPKCEGHAEPCKSMQTRKPGANCGRAFWMCARPLGPSGQKERGTQWRCPTFIWCSDWNASAGVAAGTGGDGAGIEAAK